MRGHSRWVKEQKLVLLSQGQKLQSLVYTGKAGNVLCLLQTGSLWVMHWKAAGFGQCWCHLTHSRSAPAGFKQPFRVAVHKFLPHTGPAGAAGTRAAGGGAPSSPRRLPIVQCRSEKGAMLAHPGLHAGSWLRGWLLDTAEGPLPSLQRLCPTANQPWCRNVPLDPVAGNQSSSCSKALANTELRPASPVRGFPSH